MRRLLFLVSAVLFVSCAFYKAQLPGRINAENRLYINENAGFMLTLPPEWNVGTDPKSAPKEFKTLFKTLQTNSTEALLLGSSEGQRAFVRCLAEACDSSLESYFKLLVEAGKNELTPLRADYYRGAGRELIIWSYLVRNGRMSFKMIEYVFDLGGLKCRLSFWTLPGLTDDFRQTFDDVARSICVFDTAGDSADDTAAGCTRAWIAKDSARESRPLPYACDKKELDASNLSDDPCTGPPHLCLWKVTGPSSVCYLLGSIHLAKPEMYPLNPVVERAFDSSGCLTVEVNAASPEFQEKAKGLVQGAVYRDGTQLKDHLSPALEKRLEAYCAEKGIPVTLVARFKPWFVVLFLTDLQMKSLGLSPENGIDMHFLDKSGSKRVLELETFEQQEKLLASLNGESFLSYTLADLDSSEKNINRMIKAWSCGNIAALEDMLFKDLVGRNSAEFSDILENFFFSRNKAMAAKIAGYLKEGKKCFVVVGAGHLIGKKSVVDLLQQAGYKVEQE